jgi:predicted nuclease with TOPRIM domain
LNFFGKDVAFHPIGIILQRLKCTAPERYVKALEREREASDNARRRRELEAELAQNKQAQSQLRQELEEARMQLRAGQEDGSERTRLEARAAEGWTGRGLRLTSGTS